MKKVLLLLMALYLSFGAKAQCPYTQAIDFTATDVHGTEVHLFDILDGGQYVLIDFFYTTCTYCIQTVPYMVQAYQALGCNQHDVVFLEIDTGDSEQACLNWANNHGVEYPTISGASGGTSINNQYGISYYPTVILIAPDHSIVIQDLWPIPNAQTVINRLGTYGIEEHDCNSSTYNPQVNIFVDQVLETEVTATFTPNEDCSSYSYMLATEDEMQTWMGSLGMQLPEYLQAYGFPGDMEISHVFSDLTPETEYTIYALPIDPDGNFGEVVTETVFTTNGGSSEIITDFTGIDMNGQEIHLYDILDNGQAVLINFFLYGDEYSEATAPEVVEAFHHWGCNDKDVFFMEITPNGYHNDCENWIQQFGVQYPTISRDGGGNDIAQSIPVAFYPTIMIIRPNHTFATRDVYPPTLEYINEILQSEGYELYDCVTDIEENYEGYKLFPNPANERLTLKGEKLGTVKVYNALGQKIDEFETKAAELTIPTTRYENGVYFIKVNESTLRFVITH